MTTKQQKILQDVIQLKMFAGLLYDKASMLEQGLSNVVFDKPARKGSKLTDADIAKAKVKRAISRIR